MNPTGAEAEMNVTSAAQPGHFLPGEGKTYKIGRMTMAFKTTAGPGWNAYSVCEAMEPPASGAGYHRHSTYDETFVICEGHPLQDSLDALHDDTEGLKQRVDAILLAGVHRR